MTRDNIVNCLVNNWRDVDQPGNIWSVKLIHVSSPDLAINSVHSSRRKRTSCIKKGHVVWRSFPAYHAIRFVCWHGTYPLIFLLIQRLYYCITVIVTVIVLTDTRYQDGFSPVLSCLIVIWLKSPTDLSSNVNVSFLQRKNTYFKLLHRPHPNHYHIEST